MARSQPGERMTLQDRVIVVTGAARGLGASCLRDEHGTCHGLVNNAGITMRSRLGYGEPHVSG
jgi:hypothetical protein